MNKVGGFEPVFSRLKGYLNVKNAAELAKRLDVSPQAMSDFKKKGAFPLGLLMDWAIENQVSLEWLFLGEGEMEKCPTLKKKVAINGATAETVSIPLYDVHAAAGGGTIVEMERVKSMMSFSRRVLDDLNISPKALACLYVSGDSMEPAIRAGELVIIDTSDTAFSFDGGVYVLRIENTLLIKRLTRKTTDEIEVSSDNKDRGSFIIRTKEIDGNYAIIGRVVLAWRRL